MYSRSALRMLASCPPGSNQMALKILPTEKNLLGLSTTLNPAGVLTPGSKWREGGETVHTWI